MVLSSDSEPRFYAQLKRLPPLRHALLPPLIVLLAGCSTGSWLLPALYNRFDSILAGRFEDYADFDREQRQWIRQAVDEFHYWHRHNELPRYAAMMNTLAAHISSTTTTSYEDVKRWTEQLDAIGDATASCNPLYQSGDFLAAISNRQLQQIDTHLEKRYREFVEEYEDMSPEERLEDNFRSGVKWLGRIGLNLDKPQQQHLRTMIAAQSGQRGAFMRLWRNWSVELVTLLKQRQQPGFQARVTAHLRAVESLSERNNADAYYRNRNRWIDYFATLFSSLSPDQRAEFSHWLTDTATTLSEISATPQDPVAAKILPTSSCAVTSGSAAG